MFNCSQPLLLLLLFNTVHAQIWPKQGVWSQIFARAASGGAQSKIEGSDPKVWRTSEEEMPVNVSSGKPILAFFVLFSGQNRQIRVIWGLRPAEQALLFNQNPNVDPLLYTDLIVVLLLLLTIRTVFSP